MPLQSILLAPGSNKEITPVLGTAQIISTQLVRFKPAGDRVLAEKLGGWDRFYPLALGSPVRALHAWEGINNDKHLAAGCTLSLNVITDGSGTDITPRTLTTNPSVSFTTAMGSTTVTIDDAGLTTTAYDSIYLVTPVSVGGIVLHGAYQVIATVDADTYQIQSATPAASLVTAGGAVPVFTTISGTSAINVELADHGYAIGELFPAAISTTVGGVVIFGDYIVQTVVDADNFTINSSTAATSSTSGAMNGGDANIVYFIAIAPPPPYAGYGTGTYGTGAYGLGIVPGGSTGTPITATNWTLDNWGEILLACPTGGAVYQWSPDSGFSNATKVVGAPLNNGGMFIAQPAQILVCWASSDNGIGDPLQINWSDAGDYTNFHVSSQTQAGGFRLPTSSKIVGGLSGPNFNILWTDLDVWSMDYIEVPLVFGFNAIASNCGLIARHAMGVMNTTVYWMGEGQFFRMDGENVQSVPCPVWDEVFQNLDPDNVDKIACATNTLFGEVTWYYPSVNGGGEIDSYVKMSTLIPNCWDYGLLQRTAWTDQSVLGPPIGADASGLLFQHETSPDADGQPMNSWFETGLFQIADGEQLSFADWMFPDFKYGTLSGGTGAIIQMSLKFGDYPNSTLKVRGPYSVSSATTYVNTRLRARFAALRIESTGLGSFWRMGGVKIRTSPDGKR